MAKKIPSRKLSTTKKKVPSSKFAKSKKKIPSRKLATGTAKIASRKFPKASVKKKTDAQVGPFYMPISTPALPDRPATEEELQDRIADLKEKLNLKSLGELA